MDSARASTIFRNREKSSFRADLVVSLYNLLNETKTHTGANETVVKAEIADALQQFANMANNPTTARDDIENAIAALSGSGVKAVVLAGKGNLLEAYGGLETRLATNVAIIERLVETFRLRSGKGALDYGEEEQQSQQAQPSPPSGENTK
ncbi:hypothetical protein LTR36_009186 [Oleoguttula mirabilis]|uniref:Uncharacterized protein n=1 Tax=Oleoguttula mirabilis TaxID=1507867 RepID=A0AAV9J6L3_9PEZI|nr:hypothetical protein LTR36_009186 [Oleoguttula mirabilis]